LPVVRRARQFTFFAGFGFYAGLARRPGRARNLRKALRLPLENGAIDKARRAANASKI
jgi:hypothetical protein